MSTVPQFDAIAWFALFSGSNSPLDTSELQPILEFALIWNLFERMTCNRFVKISSIHSHVNEASKSGKLQYKEFDSHLKFFRKHYPRHNEKDYLTDNLFPGIRRPNKEELQSINLLRDSLAGNSNDTKNTVYALLFIAYRIRNNLFHGEKNIYELHLQKKLFQAINSLLSIYLQQTCQGIKIIKCTSKKTINTR